MTHMEVISILLQKNSEDNVREYVASKLKINESYFKNMTEEELLIDYELSYI